MSPKEVHEKIIKSATTLFIKHGCRRITMDNIACDLHISKRTLYEHFENKEELLRSCFNYMKQLFDEKINQLHLENVAPVMTLLIVFRYLSIYCSKVSLLLSGVHTYYPDIYNQLFYTKANIHAGHMGKALRTANEMGDLRPNVDINQAVEVMAHLIKSIDTERPASEALSILSESAYTFVRGLLSIKAIERYDQLESSIRQNMQKKP